MSAIHETGEEAGDSEPIQVLFTMHNNMNALDFTGPLEILNYAQHVINDEGLHPSQLDSPEERWLELCSTLHPLPPPSLSAL
jgi:hypothetical protein